LVGNAWKAQFDTDLEAAEQQFTLAGRGNLTLQLSALVRPKRRTAADSAFKSG